MEILNCVGAIYFNKREAEDVSASCNYNSGGRSRYDVIALSNVYTIFGYLVVESEVPDANPVE